MAKRRKTIIAGRLVSELIYTAAHPKDKEHVRQAKTKISTKARCWQNLKAACRMLELILATNFIGKDLVVTLTYRDSDLPDTRQKAVKCLRQFMRDLRSHRKKHNQEFKYLYVTENKHSEGRYHHHVVINSTENDFDIIKSLWRYGDMIEIENIDVRNYKALAEYLAKEPKEAGTSNGKRMWTPSKNLDKPKQSSDWVSDRVTLEPPAGATILESCSERNEFGEYTYLKYMLPDTSVNRPCRPSRRKKQNKVSLISDLKPCIYNGHTV